MFTEITPFDVFKVNMNHVLHSNTCHFRIMARGTSVFG